MKINIQTKYMKKILFSLSICFLFFGIVGCSNTKKDTNSKKEEEDTIITISVDADENFNAKANINANTDSVIITLENGFGRNLRAITMETKQYNKKGEEVNATSTMAEYLLDGQEYIGEATINLDDKVARVEVKLSIYEALDGQDTAKLYNNLIATQCTINRNVNNISYTLVNSADVNIKDLEVILVYSKDKEPVYSIPLEDKEIGIGETIGSYDSIPPVVTAKDGLLDLDFDEVKIVINRARDN